jgi:hypothetical protein
MKKSAYLERDNVSLWRPFLYEWFEYFWDLIHIETERSMTGLDLVFCLDMSTIIPYNQVKEALRSDLQAERSPIRQQRGKTFPAYPTLP